MSWFGRKPRRVGFGDDPQPELAQQQASRLHTPATPPEYKPVPNLPPNLATRGLRRIFGAAATFIVLVFLMNILRVLYG
ncbi:MAG: hypothetical protein AB8B85_08620 [Paracoccaceae bacterium]